MKRRWIWLVVCLLLLSGCVEQPGTTDLTLPVSGFQKIDPVGEVLGWLQPVVEENRFRDVTVFPDRLLQVNRQEVGDMASHQVVMMDVYGRELAAYGCETSKAYQVSTLTATEDGGFLFVLGFVDYAVQPNVWASEQGFASRVIKCDRTGSVQFDTGFDNLEGDALQFCLEQKGCFYFFGTAQTPETKTVGVHSPTDIFMTVLDQEGTVLNSQWVGGSDYDSLDAVDLLGDRFALSVSAQSCDRDFFGADSGGAPVDWVVIVDRNLVVTEKSMEAGRSYFDRKLGYLDGKTVYSTDDFLSGFDAGTPNQIIDYGDFYLIVSEHVTGEYEDTPLVLSSIWYYTETVYSGYDEIGRLLFRTAVDSSPDYDAWLAKYVRR